MSNTIDTTNTLFRSRPMFGRKTIKSSAKFIDRENVVEVLTKALKTHFFNQSEIEYLWQYYKGNQPILRRIKEIRPEICNKIVENRANEIVSFKVGYLCGEPIQYVNRSGDKSTTNKINTLNDFMFEKGKSSSDQELVEWQMICGTAYRLVLPNGEVDKGTSPFEIYTLDPRETFVVYSNDIGNRSLMAVKFVVDNETNVTTYSVYTENTYFLIENTTIVAEEPHFLGMIPIFEYPANNAKLGSFEIVLPQLDAINNMSSNRLDAVEQTVQAFIKFVNCDITAEDFEALKDMGAIKVKSVDGANADVDVVKTDLNQDQTQTLKNDLYSSILSICGIPNRNGGSSTSDTGRAVILRDGWSLAESRAKDSENMFKKAENKMLKLVLKICSDSIDLDLKLKDIDMKFTRRNYEGIQSKSQVLISMLSQPKIHPKLAFESSGMFTDPESAYMQSMKYFDEQMKKWEPVEIDEEANDEEDVQPTGQANTETKEEDSP